MQLSKARPKASKPKTKKPTPRQLAMSIREFEARRRLKASQARLVAANGVMTIERAVRLNPAFKPLLEQISKAERIDERGLKAKFGKKFTSPRLNWGLDVVPLVREINTLKREKHPSSLTKTDLEDVTEQLAAILIEPRIRTDKELPLI